MHEWALNNPESLANLFEEQVAPFFENALTQSDKIYVQTKEMLRFYRHHFRRRQAENILYVSIEYSPLLGEAEQNKLLSKVNSMLEEHVVKNFGNQVKVILTDVKHAPQVLGLIQDEASIDDGKKDEFRTRMTVRYINYGYLYNSKTKKIYNLQDVEADTAIQEELIKDDNYIFPLKNKLRSSPPDIESLGPHLKKFANDSLNMNFDPHLESEECKFTGEKDEIPKVTHGSWDQIISKTKGRYLAIEVVAQSCQGCKSIEVILPKLRDLLSTHNISLCQVNLMTELPWLQDIQVTPSFILYDKRTK